MPELPEVETLIRALRKSVVGARVVDVRVLSARAIAGQTPRQFEELLRGRRIMKLERRGKHIVASLSDDLALLCHLRMTGRFYLQPKSPAPAVPHTRVLFELPERWLIFRDPRSLGRLQVLTRANAACAVAKLGIEPLSRGFSVRALTQLLRRSRAPIKAFLLDQTRLAGVGNIYASESLFRARIDPRRRACSVTDAEAEQLQRAIRQTLQTALRVGHGLWSAPVHAPENYDGVFYFGETRRPKVRERLLVYDREGKPCPHCGAPIRRLRQSNRSTYFCARCQK
jgi:formamidopyrimidine-DNA glycosylase